MKPVEYQKELMLGNSESSIAICSLWSERDYVARQIGLEAVRVIGNLYSHGPGIEGIVRNLLANPDISKVVIAGKDKSGSAETLKSFIQNGVTKSRGGWLIEDAFDQELVAEGYRLIDSAIPYDAIELVRQNVEFIDLRHASWDSILEFCKKTPSVAGSYSVPQTFGHSVSTIENLNGENIGFRFSGELPGMWLDILRTIRKFGTEAQSRYSSYTQEVLDVIAVIDGNTQQLIDLPHWVGVSSKSIIDYSQQLITGVNLDPEDTYAYGQRMRVSQGDQVQFLIEKLAKNPEGRGYLINLWDTENDFLKTSSNPPCLTQVWFRVFKDRLVADFSYRSHDIYGAWIKNALGDRLLQEYISNQVGIPIGETIIISKSAHIYSHNFASIDQLIADHPKRWQFTEDPRGNFIITIQNDLIIARHENSSGAYQEISGKSAQSLYKKIWQQGLLSRTDHALYLGSELQKAEQALKTGQSFNQDQA